MSTLAMIIHLVRHYLFTFTVLRRSKNDNKISYVAKAGWEPSVSILIPAHDEEHVIGRLLQRMTELTYPRHKLQVIVIDDASSDRTGEIAKEFAKQFAFIEVVSRDKITGGKGKASAMNASRRQKAKSWFASALTISLKKEL